MTEKLIPYDRTRYLYDEEHIAAYLQVATEDATAENDPGILAHAIKTIAKARGMNELAKAAGITPTTGEDSGEAPAPKKAPALAEA